MKTINMTNDIGLGMYLLCIVWLSLNACNSGTTDTTGAFMWNRSDLEGWRYELVSDERVLIFSFSGNGTVAVQGGLVGGEIAAPMLFWELSPEGVLVIFESNGDIVY